MSVLRITAILALAVSSDVAAQTNPYKVLKLADGVHAVVRLIPPDGVADSNVLVVINEADVVVVDSNILPSSAREVVAEIKKLTPKPVRYLINTHWHSDHHYGNQVYREAYPGVEFIQHAATRDLIIKDDMPSLERNLTTEYPAIIARYQNALRTGRTSRGDSVTATMRADFQASLGVYELFLKDMKDTRPIPGTLIVSDSLVLHRGERSIVVKYLGRGNTAGDLVVHLPKERILATGDLVVHPVPYAFGSHLGDWPGTLRKLKTLDASTILPGHGDIQSNWNYVDQLIPLIESTWDQVKQAVATGADLDATRKAVNLDRFRGAFGGEALRASFDYTFVGAGIEAAFKELKK